MIRGVTYDWWHTIAETPWPDYDERMREIRVERLLEELADAGVSVTAARLYEAYDRHTELLQRSWKSRIDWDAARQTEEFLRLGGLDGSHSDMRLRVERAFREAILAKPPVVYPRIAETFRGLRNRGYAIGLVSNTGRTWGRFLRPIQDALGLGEFFAVRVFSDEVGVRKPEAKIFEIALDALGLEPGEVVHIGDDPLADVWGAKALGMKAIWFQPAAWAAEPPKTADATIGRHEELLEVLEGWSP